MTGSQPCTIEWAGRVVSMQFAVLGSTECIALLPFSSFDFFLLLACSSVTLTTLPCCPATRLSYAWALDFPTPHNIQCPRQIVPLLLLWCYWHLTSAARAQEDVRNLAKMLPCTLAAWPSARDCLSRSRTPAFMELFHISRNLHL